MGDKKPTGMALLGILVGVSFSAMLQGIDATIAAVALPHMQGSLSASQDEVAWVITSYITATAIMTSPAVWLAERFGAKRIMLLSITGFTIASVITGFSTSIDQVVICRILQGAFGAPIIPISQAIVLDAYGKDAARGMAWWSVGSMLGPILGPNLGGWITENWSWPWVFFINLPFGIVAFLLVVTFVRETKTRKTEFDRFGFVSLSTFIAAIQLVMDRGSGQDWFASREILLEASIAALALYSFVVHSMTVPKPFVDFRCLRVWNFALCTFFLILLYLVITAALVLLPAFLENLAGEPVGLVGGLMAPRSVGVLIVMIAVGRLGLRSDPRRLTVFGVLCLALSMWQVENWTLNVDPWTVALNGLIQGIGTGIAFATMQGIMFAGIVPERRPGAVQVFSLARNLGQSIGTSVVTAVLIRNTQINHASIAAGVTPYNQPLHSGSAGHFWNWHLLTSRSALDLEVTRQASAIAYYDDFKLLTLVCLALIPAVVLVRTQRRQAVVAAE